VKDYGDNLFQSTAEYYARYRPCYPPALVRFLVQSFSLDGSGRLLDLGSGPGELCIRLADWFDEVVGMDPEPEMLGVAARRAGTLRIPNARWIQGKDSDLSAAHGPLRLAIIATAFHWMDRPRVLETLHGLVSPEGGVAIIDHANPPLPAWNDAIQGVIHRWLGPERKAGNSTYTHPTVRHEVVAATSPFRQVEQHTLPPYEVTRTADEIVGFQFSTSYASRRLLGENADRFADDLKRALLEINPSGRFTEQRVATVLVLRK